MTLTITNPATLEEARNWLASRIGCAEDIKPAAVILAVLYRWQTLVAEGRVEGVDRG